MREGGGKLGPAEKLPHSSRRLDGATTTEAAPPFAAPDLVRIAATSPDDSLAAHAHVPKMIHFALYSPLNYATLSTCVHLSSVRRVSYDTATPRQWTLSVAPNAANAWLGFVDAIQSPSWRSDAFCIAAASGTAFIAQRFPANLIWFSQVVRK